MRSFFMVVIDCFSFPKNPTVSRRKSDRMHSFRRPYLGKNRTVLFFFNDRMSQKIGPYLFFRKFFLEIRALFLISVRVIDSVMQSSALFPLHSLASNQIAYIDHITQFTNIT